jgi:hypothetical protein
MEFNTYSKGFTRVEDLQIEGFIRKFNPHLTGPHYPILVHILTSPSFYYIANPSLQWSTVDNTSNVSGSRGPHIPTLAIIIGGF